MLMVKCRAAVERAPGGGADHLVAAREDALRGFAAGCAQHVGVNHPVRTLYLPSVVPTDTAALACWTPTRVGHYTGAPGGEHTLPPRCMVWLTNARALTSTQ
jgi:hypothetical protein